MLKYLLIINLLVMAVVTQDMPPPELSTELPSTTLESAKPEPITTTTEIPNPTTESATTQETTTSTDETTTLSPETTTSSFTTTNTKNPEPITTTTQNIATTSEAATTTLSPESTTEIAPLTTAENDVSASPNTDSPFTPTTTTTTPAPEYPLYPNYFSPQCYFKKQYGYPQVRWSCSGLKYYYPVECFKCCIFAFSNFAGCYRVHGHHCNGVIQQLGFNK